MRGEPERVAERVRALLDEHGRAPAPAVPAAASLARRAGDRWRRLAARLPARVDPGRRGAWAVGVAVAVAAVLTGAWVLAARPSALPVSSTAPSTGRSIAGPAGRSPTKSPGPPTSSPLARSPSPSVTALVVVDVAGKVRHPGLYRLPAGSRVDDAVRAAGGALRGVRLDQLNLAAKLVDGQQVAVGVAPAAGGGVAGGGTVPGSGGAAPAGPVDLNSATLEQLQTLPGVGPVLAQHVLDWRAAHGRFTSVDQLDDVTGIGPAKFGALKPLVTV